MQPVDPRIIALRPTGCCWARLLGCGTRSPLYVIGDAASRRGLSRVGYFITLNGPLNGHPPSIVLKAPVDSTFWKARKYRIEIEQHDAG